MAEIPDEETEIPDIEDTGSTGEQKPRTGELIVPDQDIPFAAQTLPEAVQGLAATRARSMGGEVAASMLAAAFTQISNDLAELKAEFKSTREQLVSTQKDLSNCERREAVLNERVSTITRWRHLRHFAMVGGSLLVALAFQLTEKNMETQAFLIGGIGLVLILMGWIWPKSEPSQ